MSIARMRRHARRACKLKLAAHRLGKDTQTPLARLTLVGAAIAVVAADTGRGWHWVQAISIVVAALVAVVFIMHLSFHVHARLFDRLRRRLRMSDARAQQIAEREVERVLEELNG